MHLAYLSNSELPSRTANSIHVMKMCQAFSRCGQNVTLYARKGQSNNNVYSYYGAKGFEIEFSPYPRIPVFNHILYAMSNNVKLKQARTVPDILYARHIYSLYASRNIGTRLIYEAHMPPANPLQKRIERKLFSHRNFSFLVVISNALKDEYLHQFPELKPEQILTAHDAADPPPPSSVHESCDIKWPGRHGVFQVGYTGHLYPGKGMEVVSQLASRIPCMDFHVIGGTDSDIAYWKSVSNPKNLYYHGFVPHSFLSRYYNNINALLAPYQQRVAAAGSKGDISAWMSPLKLFEYMSSGRPIICSDLPVLREIVQDGNTALMVSPCDIAAWESALTYLSENPRAASGLALNALDCFNKLHTWDARANKIISKLAS